MFKGLIKSAGSLSTFLGYTGGYIFVCIMLLTVCDVIGRYFFNSPITGAYEVTEALLATAVFFFIAFAHTRKGHIAVDLILIILPRRIQVAIRIITHLMSLCILIILAWMNILRWLELIARNEHTPIIHLPVSPFVLIVALGFFVLSIEFIKDILRLLTQREI